MSADAAATPLVAGTAGHVDHGKTALVRTLTGVDTDRLEAERARGLSIELGFAAVTLPSGRPMSLVDVPGHERFIATMVAGASGIDCFVMVIAATEGVRAQTTEHARILAALAVCDGITVITKTDLADPGPASRAARELLPSAPVLISPADPAARRPALLDALDALAGRLPGRPADTGPAVMHVDRAFTIAGAGTVVTGTLVAGSIATGDVLRLEPQGRPARVRGLQVHGVAAAHVPAGRRLAVNLARVPRDGVGRGDVLAGAGAVSVAHVVEVALDAGRAGPPELADGTVVHVHHGTRATAARVRIRRETVTLRCREPLIVAAGDRLVIRDAARRVTLGGARVTGWRLNSGVPGVSPGEAAVSPPASPTPPASRLAASPPLASPVAVTPGPAAPAEAPAPPPLDDLALILAARLRSEGAAPTSDRGLGEDERARLHALVGRGLIVRLADGHHAAPEAVAAVERVVRELIDAGGAIALGELRDRLGGSRSQAKAFLDYFDRSGLTRRLADDRRVLRRRAAR